jgi:hypothetical protein
VGKQFGKEVNKGPSRRIVFRKFHDYTNGLMGRSHPNGLIEVDPRQDEQDLFDTLIHELLHREFPDLSEEAVERAANRMSWDLWKQSYRRFRE